MKISDDGSMIKHMIAYGNIFCCTIERTNLRDGRLPIKIKYHHRFHCFIRPNMPAVKRVTVCAKKDATNSAITMTHPIFKMQIRKIFYRSPGRRITVPDGFLKKPSKGASTASQYATKVIFRSTFHAIQFGRLLTNRIARWFMRPIPPDEHSEW